MLKRVRWAVLLLSVGCVLGFVGGVYYLYKPVLWAAVATLVGVPMALIGLGLKGAELAPVRFTPAPPDDIAALSIKATPTQVQILEDATRYQYGLSVHLEPALERLGIASEETDAHPTLIGIREVVIDGAYGLVLEFATLEDVTLDNWQEKETQMNRFFGPNVNVTATSPSPDKIAVTIVATAEATEMANSNS